MADQTLPIIMTTQGAQPIPPATLLSMLLALASTSSPGITQNLPGTLIEDITSTDVGALTIADSARVETINSMSPYACNAFLLQQLGQMLGIPIGTPTNTSVYVVFTAMNGSSPVPGYAIAVGFTVTDGANQYTVQAPGGITSSDGISPPLFCLATQPGSFSVSQGTVNQLVTSVPGPITLTCTNPQPGTPGNPNGETEPAYRVRVLQANLASAQGMPRFVKTMLGAVPGVNSALVSILTANNGWEIIVGGNGDPYQIAYAIFIGLFDITTLVGSVINVTGITNATLGVVTTNLNHGLTTGQNNVFIAGVVGMTGVNGGPYTVNVLSEKTFTFGVNTTSSGTYVSGGVITPNTRNQIVSIIDTPNTYNISFVVPPQQSVSIGVVWNSNATNAISNEAIQAAVAPALVNYVNAIGVGQPINLFVLQSIFQQAVASILPAQNLIRMVFTVDINGVMVPPQSGTGEIFGDPESYFLMTVNNVTCAQG